MRYYVILPSPGGDDPPHIVAETVRDDEDIDTDRALTLAGGIGGSAARILTETELEAEPRGRESLAAWNAGDDRAFRDVGEYLAAVAEAEPRRVTLRIVAALPDAAPLLAPTRIPRRRPEEPERGARRTEG